jgi:ABC-type dipeptide/oligopeptide/nickel transport system ATPase subunit
MSVKLAFSVAAQINVPIMMLDEVLAVGDFVFQEKCFALFEKYKKEGKTIILVTHDPGAMERFADRAMLIHQSRVEIIGNTLEVIDRYHKINKSWSICIHLILVTLGKRPPYISDQIRRWYNESLHIINDMPPTIKD